jgi:lipopolysaccharide/colanic/teichoic acid biosynthesis glycosyltransferase
VTPEEEFPRERGDLVPAEGAPPAWLRSPPAALSGGQAWRLKERLDRVAAGSLLLLFSPLLLTLALAIRIETRGPILFRQVRIGQFGRPFTAVKFRSMVEGAESVGLGLWTARDDDRITRVGKWLRLTSLDELPQLINVAKGDMSLVGPRPGLPDQAERYTALQRQRLRLRPGITGWAQVNGRNAISWERRIELDRLYARHWSLLLDAYILWRTPAALFDGTGIYGTGERTTDLGEE